MSKEINIDICVITYKRPEGLTRLISSLLAIKTSPYFRLNLYIIDNDSDGSAHQTVMNFYENEKLNIVYMVEPCRGISEARNKALLNAQGEYICFVDDDEAVSEGWLTSLFNIARAHNADVVFGPVIRVLPGKPPAWLTANNLYIQARHKSGTIVEYGGSGNVMIKRQSLGKPVELFSHDYTLTGGGDTEFFYRLHKKGRKLVWCDEAIVEEYVDSSRLTIKWYLKRSFRSGQVYVRVFINDESNLKKYRFIFFNTVGMTRNIILLPFFRLLNYERYVFLLGKISMTAGFLTASLPLKVYYQAYK